MKGRIRVTMTSELVEHTFREGNEFKAGKVTKGLPKDARLVQASFDRDPEKLVLDFETASVKDNTIEEMPIGIEDKPKEG